MFLSDDYTSLTRPAGQSLLIDRTPTAYVHERAAQVESGAEQVSEGLLTKVAPV